MGNQQRLGDAREAFTAEILPKEVFGGCLREIRLVYRTARRVWMWYKPHDKLRQQVVMEGDGLKRL